VIDQMPTCLRDHPDRPRPLKPSAEECFKKSLALAPDQVETHEELFRYYRQHDQDDKAVRAANDLLARFPDRVEALADLGELHMNQQRYAEALTCFQRALKNNPLDRRLRERVSAAHLYVARTHAEAGRFDEARREYQASIAIGEGNHSAALCKWAACEFKAGDTARGEELLQKALAELGDAGNELAVAYSMLIEVIRLKLPGTYKTRFNKIFNEGLAAPPTGKAAAELAANTASHQVAGITYHGQKTHQKKVLDYLKKAEKASFTEDELERLCRALLPLKSYRLANSYFALGQRKFPKNPMFPYLLAQNELGRGPGNFNPWQVRQALEKAEKLAQDLPRDKKQEELLERIRERLELVGSFNPFARIFGGDFDPFGYYDDDDDYEDEYEAGW
jgi:tetratricopeptide (TPR) repeat protein